MKKFYYILIILFLFLTLSVCFSLEMDVKLNGKVIVIDVGHGGVDGGSSEQGIYEKDLNLKIALKLKEELIKSGATVYLTRDDDYDLSSPNVSRRKKSDFDNRINYINNLKADMYLSIHINYFSEKKYYGAQVFYTDGNELLANSIQNEFIKYLDSPLKEKRLSNDIYMYQHLKIPGVLIECGFLSNVKERNLLIQEEYQLKVAKLIVKGILVYY